MFDNKYENWDRNNIADDDTFWAAVELVDWKSGTSNTEAHMRLVAAGYDMMALENAADLKVNPLYKHCYNAKAFQGLGDDGYGDAINECVGRGREFYEAILADPEHFASIDGNYRESFAYVWHVPSPRTWEEAAQTVAHYRKEEEESKAGIDTDVDLLLIEIEDAIEARDKAEMDRLSGYSGSAEKDCKTYYRVAKMNFHESCYGIPNLLSDYCKMRDYLA